MPDSQNPHTNPFASWLPVVFAARHMQNEMSVSNLMLCISIARHFPHLICLCAVEKNGEIIAEKRSNLRWKAVKRASDGQQISNEPFEMTIPKYVEYSKEFHVLKKCHTSNSVERYTHFTDLHSQKHPAKNTHTHTQFQQTLNIGLYAARDIYVDC